MPERLEEKTKAALRSYLSDVRASPNEWATTHRFATLIGELFPGSPAGKEFAAGEKRGRIDSYYGNAVIEVEPRRRNESEFAFGKRDFSTASAWRRSNETSTDSRAEHVC